MLNRYLAEIAQRIVGWVGYELAAKGSVTLLSRRAESVGELEEAYRRFLFPDLPRRAGRDRVIARLEGTQSSEALYIVEYLHRSLSRPGDVCEFGVAQGATSALLATEMAETAKKLWLFDSFEGLPRPSAKDVLIHDIFELGSIEKYAGTMAFEQDHVMRRLRDVDVDLRRVNVVPGFIEKTIASPALPTQVCFAYVDFDFYEPIQVALEYLDRTLVPGGHVIVDDYGWFSAGAQAAVDEFIGRRSERFELIRPIPEAGHFVMLARRS